MKQTKTLLCILISTIFLTGCSGEAELFTDVFKLSGRIVRLISGTPEDTVETPEAEQKEESVNSKPKGSNLVFPAIPGQNKLKEIARKVTDGVRVHGDSDQFKENQPTLEEREKELFAPIKKTIKDPSKAKYLYIVRGRRDPFQSILISVNPIVKIPEAELQPLQKVDIAHLHLFAIVWGKFGYKAMVQTPDGKTYIVKKGMPVGKSNGTVKSITSDEIIVEAKSVNALGKVISKIDTLKLRQLKEKS